MSRTSVAVLLVLIVLPTTPLAQVTYDRTLDFSGYDWHVKKSPTPAGPGPNHFSDDTRAVKLDSRGRLHLRIAKRDGLWQCAEVVSTQSFGHGTYRFYLDRRVDNLDPNVVLGLFTWNDRDPSYNYREIDIEFARWGWADDPTSAQYVVQPYDVPGNLARFALPPALRKSTHSFLWLPSSISFQSLIGHLAAPPDPGDVISELTQTSASVPPAGGENVRMNLWLFNGTPPRRSAKVVVSRFEFVPAP